MNRANRLKDIKWKRLRQLDIELMFDKTEPQAVLFDIDGTLTVSVDVWDILITHSRVASWRKIWLYGTAMPHYLLTKLGLADQGSFRDRWVRLMAWLMSGWTQTEYRTICKRIVNERLIPTLRDDMVAVLEQYKNRDCPTILVSTMFDGIVSGVVEHLGATAGLGSQVELQNGRCTGRIVGLTCSGARKVDFARSFFTNHMPQITLDVCAGYADSASDIPFIAATGYPVATYPDDAMRQAAIENGWRIIDD